MTAKLRALVIAEAANPEWVSVPLVGWSHARALASVLDVHVVTQVRNREAIERTGWREGEQFTAIDSEAVAAPVHRLASWLRGGSQTGWTTGMALNALAYPYFERLVWKRFGADVRGGRFDVVHRLTPLSPTLPSPLAGHCHRAGVPFVLGPLNGGVPWPRAFDAARREEREWLSYVRRAYRLVPGHRATLRHASALILGSSDTWAEVPERYREKCFFLPENGIDPTRFAAVRTRRAAPPLRVLFVGRLVPYKGADMLLEAALPLLRAGSLQLEILGDGPQRGELERRCRAEDVAAAVTLRGWVEHAEVARQLVEADLLALPSIREFGGGVVLEAMASGLAPLVVDYGGPADLVDDAVGFRIPLAPREGIVRRLRETLEELAGKPRELDERGDAARQRVLSQHTWERRAEQVAAIYAFVTGRGPRPELRPPRAATDLGQPGGRS